MKIEDYKFTTRERKISYTQLEIELDGHWFSVRDIFNILLSIEECEDVDIDDNLSDALVKRDIIKWSNNFDAYKRSTNFKSFKDALSRTVG